MGSNQLGIESQCSWATVGSFTTVNEHPCGEDGTDCTPTSTRLVEDVSKNIEGVQMRLASKK